LISIIYCYLLELIVSSSIALGLVEKLEHHTKHKFLRSWGNPKLLMKKITKFSLIKLSFYFSLVNCLQDSKIKIELF